MNKLKTLLISQPHLEKYADIKKLSPALRIARASDFALSQGCMSASDEPYAPRCWHFLEEPLGQDLNNSIAPSGELGFSYVKLKDSGIVPALDFELPILKKEVFTPRKSIFGCDYLVMPRAITMENGEKIDCHTITFSSARQPLVAVSEILETQLESEEPSRLKPFRHFSGRMREDSTLEKFKTYKYHGQEFCRARASTFFQKSHFMNGLKVYENEWTFIAVCPAPLLIRNDWDSLPSYINPNGTGEAKILKTRMLFAMTSGIPLQAPTDKNIKSYLENEFVDEFFL